MRAIIKHPPSFWATVRWAFIHHSFCYINPNWSQLLSISRASMMSSCQSADLRRYCPLKMLWAVDGACIPCCIGRGLSECLATLDRFHLPIESWLSYLQGSEIRQIGMQPMHLLHLGFFFPTHWSSCASAVRACSIEFRLVNDVKVRIIRIIHHHWLSGVRFWGFRDIFPK